MENYKVRIKDVTINNFMNIRKGYLSFVNPNRDYLVSILGLYGQNGSGKTALINALDILKSVLSGQAVPDSYSDCISVGYDFSSFSYTFLLTKCGNIMEEVIYSFSMGQNKGNAHSNDDTPSLIIFNEVLKTRLYREKDERIGRIIDTSSEDVVSPKSKKELLFGRRNDERLSTIRKNAESKSGSFIFSAELLLLIEERKKTQNETSEFYYSLLNSLSSFGSDSFFVINTSNNALIAMNAEPLNFKLGKGGGTIAVPIEGKTVFPESELPLIREILDKINIVLKTIIPGLTISLDVLEQNTLYTGERGVLILLMSDRNGVRVPFSRESEGIKKLVSILQLFTSIFNTPGVTVAIDELDTSIFEYLLGEILSILSEAGQGQLIFTAHNLRPLETLDKGFIAFTTTDPDNRFIRLKKLRETNNLRNTYFRNIFLNESYDNLYQETLNSEITMAFCEAGGCFDE